MHVAFFVIYISDKPFRPLGNCLIPMQCYAKLF